MFSHKRILIKGGKVVNDDGQFDAEVYIEGDKIKMVGPEITVVGDVKVIDARGKLVIPGGINIHTHLLSHMDEAENFYNGTKYAMAGGTTMIMDYAIDPNSHPIEVYRKWRTLADKKVCCDYGLHIALNSWSNDIRKQMEILTQEGGINSFMICSAIKDLKENEKFDQFFNVFAACQRIGAIASFHPQNLNIAALNKHLQYHARLFPPEEKARKRLTETVANESLIVLAHAKKVQCPMYMLQVPNINSAEIVCQMLDEDCSVYGEVILSGAIAKDNHQLKQEGKVQAAGYGTSPAVNDLKMSLAYLRKLLSRGIVQNVGMDSCNYNAITESKCGGSDATTGNVRDLENVMSHIWDKTVASGCLTPSEFVAVTSTNAAKMLNLYPNKGRIQVDSEANVVVWDPDGHRTITPYNSQGSNDFRIFEGVKIRGKAVNVIYRGRIVVEEGELLSLEPGSGRFIPCLPFSPYVYLPLRIKTAGRLLRKKSKERKCQGGEGDKSNSEHDEEECQIVFDGREYLRETNIPHEVEWMPQLLLPHEVKGRSSSPEEVQSVTSNKETMEVTPGIHLLSEAEELSGDEEKITPSNVAETPSGGSPEKAQKDHRRFKDLPEESPFIGGSFRRNSDSEFRVRPPTRSGSRNLLDSTFSLSGAQIDDDQKTRPTIRVRNPPGGRSSGIWFS